MFIGLKTYFMTGWNAFEFAVLSGLIGVTYMKVLTLCRGTSLIRNRPPRKAPPGAIGIDLL